MTNNLEPNGSDNGHLNSHEPATQQSDVKQSRKEPSSRAYVNTDDGTASGGGPIAVSERAYWLVDALARAQNKLRSSVLNEIVHAHFQELLGGKRD